MTWPPTSASRTTVRHKSVLSLQAHSVFARQASQPYIGRLMELQKIKQLIDVMAASDLAEIELVEGDHRVRLVRRGVTEQPTVASRPETPAAGGPARGANEFSKQPADLVLAPLYGVLHLTPSPDAAVFVQPGDTVATGQTLCVIESMKMFHEVKAPRRARIAAVLAQAGEEVQAGAALFHLQAAEPA